MERSAFLLAALIGATAVFSSACNDLGSCDDPARGRTTVSNAGGEFMFTGQAILNNSCAPCHGSKVTGAGRRGAPAGLDFDLFPLPAVSTEKAADGSIVGVLLDSEDWKALRTRQRKVYDERELIWEQVEKGLMPPESTSTFKNLSTYFRSMFTSSDMKCSRGTALTDLGAHREEFRTWLACDVPIVEAASNMLPYKALPAGATPADSAAGAGYYSIPNLSVGYQYPSCAGGGGDGGMSGGNTPGFDEVYNTVLAKSSNTCLACHSGAAAMGMFDIGTLDKAWMTLMGSGQGGATTCATSPVYVTPNDPEKSYLLNMVVTSKTRCTDNVMPLGSTTGLPTADVDLITRWIAGGAPRTAPATGGGSDAGGGGDGGVDGGR
jgi:hypothetical protein